MARLQSKLFIGRHVTVANVPMCRNDDVISNVDAVPGYVDSLIISEGLVCLLFFFSFFSRLQSLMSNVRVVLSEVVALFTREAVTAEVKASAAAAAAIWVYIAFGLMT